MKHFVHHHRTSRFQPRSAICSFGAHYFQPHFMPIYSRAFFYQTLRTIHKHGCLEVLVLVHHPCYTTTQGNIQMKMVQGEIKIRNGVRNGEVERGEVTPTVGRCLYCVTPIIGMSTFIWHLTSSRLLQNCDKQNIHLLPSA